MKLKKKAIIASLITLIPSLIGLLALYLYDDSITEELQRAVEKKGEEGKEWWKTQYRIKPCQFLILHT